MVRLTVENLSRSYGEKVLFENISFGIGEGQKCGLIAPNGSGKSTLLKILAGIDDADEGVITWNKETRSAYLPQEPHLEDEDTVLEALFKQAGPVGQTLKKYYQIQDGASEESAEHQKALEEMEANKAWELDVLVRKILSRLEVPEVSTKCKVLSGGQRKRVALSAVLLMQPDFLLLDEPTNHLDLPMNEWLENYLATENLSILMVTHDRYFLERVCNRIFEMESTNLFIYEGNYHYFLRKRAERKHGEAVRAEKAGRLLKEELKWLNTQPKARGTKSKARSERAELLREEVEGQQEPEQDIQLSTHINRLGKKIIELKRVTKAFNGDTIIKDLSHSFKHGEKLGVTGKNGTGKSTFLKLINGELQADSGKIITGETVKIGYYRQEGMQLNDDKKVIDVVRDIAENIELSKNQSVTPEQFLERFMFDRKQQHQKVSTLSGGEKKRLYLVTILIEGPNFLMLDEPTNDLDLLTINRLEEFLTEYKGCAVIVTHDRYFLDKMIDHLFVFQGEGRVKDYPGNYSEYRDKVQNAEKKKPDEEKASKKKKSKPKSDRSKKLSYKEKLELENIENEIIELENEKEKIEAKIQEGQLSSEKVMEATDRLTDVIKEIENKTERWFELEEKRASEG